MVLNHGSGESVGKMVAQPSDSNATFDVEALPNGDYDVVGFAFGDDGQWKSPAKAVSIRDASVSGILLTVAQPSRISGRVTLEAPADPDPCPERPQRVIGEALVRFDRAPDPAPTEYVATEAYFGQPGGDGSFESKGMSSGLFWPTVDLPDDRWYVRSIADNGHRDLASSGIALKAAGSVSDVAVTIGHGAATVAGKVEAGGGNPVPDGASVALVPVDPKEVDDVLRYFKTDVEADGSFSISHIPPGKYRVVALLANERPKESRVPFGRIAPDRKMLGSLAVSRGVEVDARAMCECGQGRRCASRKGDGAMMARALGSRLVAIAVLAGYPIASHAQSQSSGSVSGTVTVDGKPAAGVSVILARDSYGVGQKPVASGATDARGVFSLPAIAPGKYVVLADAPAFVSRGAEDSGGITVVVGDGEAVKGIALTLERGGVITGRITNGEGKALVGQQISLFRVDADGSVRQTPFGATDFTSATTDDRGIYRMYGLGAGTYLVAAGVAQDGTSIMMGSATKQYNRLYFPGVPSSETARRIEVASGSETSGIDIALGDQTARYSVSGRVVDAQTGAPFAGLSCGYGAMRDGRMNGAIGFSDRSDATGHFLLTGVPPGSYGALAEARREGRSYFPEAAPFEVVASNVDGVEIKMYPGGSLVGTLTAEGFSPEAAAAAYQSIWLGLRAEGPIEGFDPSRFGAAKIAPDGSFTIIGLRSGDYRFELWPRRDTESAASIVRVERDGVPVTGAISVKEGETTSGLRLVFATGSSIVRGTVVIAGGKRPAYMQVSLLLPGSGLQMRTGDVDRDGHFAIDRVPAGDYLIRATGEVGDDDDRRVSGPEKQVTVGTSGTTSVDVSLDMSDDAANRGADR